ncbi:MAG: DinB family protein [Lewinellaceae bacterium]|nr:hypothetical protein [Saprospiraceae bacterium]MCB9311937.1 DinB family protein [Lewinellaceae bacterium]HRW76036.1 DinB family protein [Saprospiraceae bacterium]
MFQPVIQASQALLSDLKQVLINLPATQYAGAQDVLSGASVGQHVRHLLEFYQCLLDQCPRQEVNYSLRIRDLQLEQSAMVATQTCDDLIRRLNEVNRDLTLTLHMDDLDVATGPVAVPSSLARELIYCVEHAIHHMAIIKIGIMQQDPRFILPEGFGVAPSTIRYRASQCAQ